MTYRGVSGDLGVFGVFLGGGEGVGMRLGDEAEG